MYRSIPASTITRISALLICYSLISFGCAEEQSTLVSKLEIPETKHDLGYIPFDVAADDPDHVVCDSTDIRSGRNRIQYVGGYNKLKEDIVSNFTFHQSYEGFNGYVVIRFMVNCEGKYGRYRAQSLALDFSPSDAPKGLMESSMSIVKSLDSWVKSPGTDGAIEYSKYINLKFDNGKIQHVLL